MELIKYQNQTVFQEDVLLESPANGDSHAFGRRYSHYSKIFKFINGMLNSREDAEEILHDIFADLWERKLTLTEIGSLNSYLYKMAKYKLINFREHWKVRQKADVYLDMEGSSRAADTCISFPCLEKR